ncbi:MAG: tetratricopeptide repeat protein [Calditrichia bacterium]|nr:tetratricopeptide repeat protein [Calditrichia bacterium]
MGEKKIKSFSYQSKIEHGEHTFTVHSGNVDEKKLIISEIFEEGSYVSTRMIDYMEREVSATEIRYDFLSEVAREFHLDVADETEALFTISKKIEKRDSPYAHFQLGVILLNKNFLGEAEKHFKFAIKKKPELIRAHFGLAVIKLWDRNYEAAAKILENCRDSSNDYPDYYNYCGVSYLLQRNFTKAIYFFKKAITINPEFAESQFNLGVALYFSALIGVNDEKAIGLPARVTIYLKQMMAKNKFKTVFWKSRFKEILQVTRSQDSNMIKEELLKFVLEATNLSSEKDKVYEFFLRFMFGGREIDAEHIANFQPYFEHLQKEVSKYPDIWNDVGTFNLINSRSYLMKAIDAFEKASILKSRDGDIGEGAGYYNLVKGKGKGILLLLRAILKQQY